MHPLEYVIRVPQVKAANISSPERPKQAPITVQPTPRSAQETPCIGVPFVEWVSDSNNPEK